MCSSLMSLGDASSALRTGVSSGNTPHTSHVVFFPHPPKNDTVSHPVMVWNIGNADDLSWPNDVAMVCAGRLCRCFPVPQAIHSSSTRIVLTTEMAKTITSVSLLLIFIRLWPDKLASNAWTIKRVAASSWMQGCRTGSSILLVVDKTPSPCVV